MLKKVIIFLNKMDGIYPLSSIERRKQNIQFLFEHTIQWMPTIVQMYDTNYAQLKDHKKARDKTFEDLQILEKNETT
jgi:hypothetical protein